MKEINRSFNKCVQSTIVNHWEQNSVSDYGETTFRYCDVAAQIEKMHILFAACGVEKGDKIALCGKNSSHWGMNFFAILTYGAVAVPILHEFHPEQIHQIVTHSETKIFFVDDKIWQTLDTSMMPNIKGAVSLTDNSAIYAREDVLKDTCDNLNRLFCEKFPNELSKSDIHYHVDEAEELAIINYTSGTTSNSKGVMLPYRTIWSNYVFAEEVLTPNLQDEQPRILSMLPMAHMYGMAFEFIYEFICGFHIYFLTKAPSPAVLMKAFADIKPSLIIAVPLIMEKIVRKAILPKVKEPKVALMLKLPIIGSLVRKKICEGLTNALGGNFYEVVMGGAALNKEVEDVLHDIKFHYTVGYGATECAPILSYRDWKEYAPGSCGKAAPRMELKIDSTDPENIPGEILARGMNVMQGYYKNEEETAKTLKDGWYHTGDLGIIDKEGNVFIKGRSKNMLLSANGQNVYPEEIEDKLVGLPLVAECVVIQKGEKFYGLVYPDPEKTQGMSVEAIAEQMEENRKTLNELIPAYEHLSGIKVMEQEFEKTPKKSIKRFLYINTEV